MAASQIAEQRFRFLHVRFSLILLLASSCLGQLSCYNPDGSDAPEDHTPCNGTARVTHCCSSGSACLTNGLCFLQWDTSVNTGTCTDRNWNDKSCFQPCLQGMIFSLLRILFLAMLVPLSLLVRSILIRILSPAHGAIGSQSTLYRCDANFWCCSAGGNITSCCPEQNNQFRLQDIAQVQNGTAFAPGFTITPLASTMQSLATGSPTFASADPQLGSSCPSLSASASAQQCHTDQKKTLAAGLGTGLGIGVPLLAALGGVLFLLSREKRENANLKRNAAAYIPHHNGYPEKIAPQGSGLHEMPNNPPRTPELPTSPVGSPRSEGHVRS